MTKQSWAFFLAYEKSNEVLRGLSSDLVEKAKQWQMIYEAKEPDNLPLHEPWYSRLTRFHKLVIVGALRTDKLMELATTFVSDHVGYKFVEPVQLDLGRVFSGMVISQAFCFTTSR